MRNAPPAPRRRRPHPARRARRIAAGVSLAGMVVLTGCMTIADKTSTGTTATTNASTAATATTGSTADEASRDDDSFSAPAVAATPSPQPDTSTHAS